MQSSFQAPQDTNISTSIKGKKLILDEPLVMGILNVTPDSFFDGGKYQNEQEVINQTQKMINEGATFIDVGAYSSRPKAEHISEQTELDRILPIITLLRKEFPEIIISADTFRSQVAKKCVEAGADIINDISGGTMDSNMFETIAQLDVPYILMHIKGTPQSMQTNPSYKNVVKDVKSYFSEKLEQLNKLGVKQVILDPGFGFGKTVEHNYQLLSALDEFKEFGLPILTGVSRKSMINKVLNTTPKEALNGTTVLNTIALLKGAKILRVHDVKEAKQAIQLVKQLHQ